MKKIFFIAGGSALLLIAILAGAFFAGPLLASANTSNTTASPGGSTTQNQYCTQYQQDLASKLNVSVSTLQQDSKAARIDIVNQLVKDGKLTQNQANTLIQRIQASEPCTHSKGYLYGPFVIRQFVARYRDDMVSQIAQGLHLSSSQLTAQLQSGKSLEQIAKAQNISSSQLKTIVTNAVTSDLNKAVSAGDLTQAQQTAITTFLQHHPRFIGHVLHHHFHAKNATAKAANK